MKRRFFTLVELLAAVALITILAGIGFAGYSYAMNSAKESATKSLIARFGAALETLKTNHGFYPVTGTAAAPVFTNITMTVNSDGLITGIAFSPTVKLDQSTADKKKQLKDFLAIVDAETLKKHLKNGVLVDSWGGNIHYAYPGAANSTKFDLVAPGPDGGFGTTGNAAAPTAGTVYRDASGDWACDDLANF